jgi:protein-S-isoprenylcysteine O-methyltransferase Ste14
MYDGGNMHSMKPSALFVTVLPLLSTVALCLLVRPAAAAWSAPRIAGLVLLIFGMALLTVARIQLGNSFSIVPRATELVTHGLYARIRNPVYVFSAVAIAGFVLYLGRLNLFAIFLILIPLQVRRARAEARVLEERFGEEYRRYRAGTWF